MTEVAGYSIPAHTMDAPLPILMTSTSYPASADDWKGLFIQRLVHAMARRTDLQLQLWSPSGPIPEGVGMAWCGSDQEWLDTLASRGGIAHELRALPVRGAITAACLLWRLRRAYRQSRAELLHVNWLQNAIALPNDGRPSLVTALGSDMALLRLPLMKHFLRRAFRSRPVALCPNADWMVPELERAFGDIARVECVPFGVDSPWYGIARHPVPTMTNRWLCISRLTVAKLGPLFDWAAPHFSGTKRELHLFGPHQESGIQIPDWVHFHGPVKPIELQREWFTTATGLVSLSRHAEGRPQVMLEAMAAGLPILASRLPAHDDIVCHAETGWLCDDPAGFAEGLAVIEDPQRNRSMGVAARDNARTRFGDWDDCAKRYVHIYEALLGKVST